MATVTVQFVTGQRVGFEIDVGREGPAFFLLSVRKCGSTFFNQIANAVADANGRNFVDMGATLFDQNILPGVYCVEPALATILYPGNAYGGFRDMPMAFLRSVLFLESPKLLLIRDPRDALVSEYFSAAFSHPIPKVDAVIDAVNPGVEGRTPLIPGRDLLQELRRQALSMDIDDWVLKRAHDMVRTMMQYAPIVDSPHLTVLKYEDYVFNKAAMISLIADRFGWHVDDALIKLILDWADLRPQREDPHAFVRHVAPGDHRNKLRPQTITTLNELVKGPMQLFAYRP